MSSMADSTARPARSSLQASLRFLLPHRPPPSSTKVRSALLVLLLASLSATASILPFTSDPVQFLLPQMILLALALASSLFDLMIEPNPRPRLRAHMTSSSPLHAFIGAQLLLVYFLRFLLLPAYVVLLVLSALHAQAFTPALLLLPACTLSAVHLMRR